MSPGIEWDWVKTPATDLTQSVVASISHLFETMTRVTLLIQRIGATIAMHRDQVFGNDYGSGPHRPEFGVPPHSEHAHNGFLSLKGALTEKPGDNGCPVIRFPENGPDMRYDTGDRFFLINEVDALHGARACNHHRGVIWVDGWLNRAVIDNIKKHPVRLTALDGATLTLITP